MAVSSQLDPLFFGRAKKIHIKFALLVLYGARTYEYVCILHRYSWILIGSWNGRIYVPIPLATAIPL